MRIKLYAYFAGNPGDDMMVRLLLERYPKITFFAPTWTVESEVFRKFPNFENMEAIQRRYGRMNRALNILFPFRRDFYLKSKLKRIEKDCVCALYIGGSVYTERTSPDAEEAKLAGPPLFVIGANYGRRPGDFADYFRRCAGVTFRDRASYERFSGLSNVGYAPDVVLSFRGRSGPSKGDTLINVMELHRPGMEKWADGYESKIAELCACCERPVLVSFCRKEGDEEALARLSARVPQAAVYRYRGDLEKLQELFSGAESVIATRLHAMILAFCHKKPVFAFAYDEKIRNVAEDMGFDGICPISELETINPKELILRCGLPENLEIYQQKAAEQFRKLDEFLEENHGTGQHYHSGF